MNTLITPNPPPAATATLHLTQILVPYEDAVRLLRIRDTYDWHQAVWKSLERIIPRNPNKGRFPKGMRPEDQPKTPPDFLCRIDKIEENFRVLLLSTKQPQRPNWCPTDCFGTKEIPDKFFKHPRYRFSLLANPTKKLRVDNTDGTRKKNGRRVPLTKREDLIAWLQGKAKAGGFAVILKREDDFGKEVEVLRTIPRGREFFHKDGRSHGTHTAVEFQGELTVTDPKKFRATVAAGIGSAKAFGFGLLVLAPLSTAD